MKMYFMMFVKDGQKRMVIDSETKGLYFAAKILNIDASEFLTAGEYDLETGKISRTHPESFDDKDITDKIAGELQTRNKILSFNNGKARFGR